MTWNPNREVFSLTMSKMGNWHRHTKHKHNLVESTCVFCEGKMAKVAKFLKTKGFKIEKVGSAFLEIEAKQNPRHATYGDTTDEVDKLFNIVSGRIID